MNAKAILALEKYLETRINENNALFISERSPYQKLQKEVLEKIIRTLDEKAEVGRRVYPHLIRHTTAIFLLRHGMPLKEVQDYLGYENINTTRIYTKFDRDSMINSFKKCMI